MKNLSPLHALHRAGTGAGHGLPIIAANVSREDGRRILREGLAPIGFDNAVPPDVLAQQTAIVAVSHCGLLPDGLAPRMALMQAARDQFMARELEKHAARGALLLAGKGHVRTDLGVPRGLDGATRARTLVVGMLERGDDSTAFDRIVFTAPQPRPDPCAGMKPLQH